MEASPRKCYKSGIILISFRDLPMTETTIVNPPSNDTGAGWAVALVILIVVIVGGFFWYKTYGIPAPAQNSGTNINVTIPTPGGNNNGGATTP